jgi:hypothetical protein
MLPALSLKIVGTHDLEMASLGSHEAEALRGGGCRPIVAAHSRSPSPAAPLPAGFFVFTISAFWRAPEKPFRLKAPLDTQIFDMSVMWGTSFPPPRVCAKVGAQ